MHWSNIISTATAWPWVILGTAVTRALWCLVALVAAAEAAGSSLRAQRSEDASRRRGQLPQNDQPAIRWQRSAGWCNDCLHAIPTAAASIP